MFDEQIEPSGGELAQEIEVLKGCFSNSGDGVIVARVQPSDMRGWCIVYANLAMTAMTGYKIDDIPGEPLRILSGAETDRTLFKKMWADLERGEPTKVELLFYRKDGSPFWAEVSVNPITRDNGSDAFLLYTFRDTSIRRQVEESLLECKKRYLEATRASSVGLWAWNLKTNKIRLDPSLKEILGYEYKEGLCEMEDRVLHVYPEDLPADEQRVKAHIEGLTPNYESEYRILHKNGSALWFMARGKIVKDSNDDVSWMLGTLTDITERKMAETALEHRVEIEKLGANISSHFTGLPSAEVDGGINLALESIGRFSNADRSYVFMLRENGTTADNTHEWCVEGNEPQISKLNNVPVATFPWPEEQLRRLENIHIRRVADLADGINPNKQILQSQNIQSQVVVPLVQSSKLTGFLGLDWVRTENTWTEEDISLLRMVGEVIGNALERKRVDDALQDSEAGFRQFAENVGEIIWLATPSHNKIEYISPAYELLTGVPCQYVYENSDVILNTVHRDDRTKLEKWLAEFSKSYNATRETFRIIRPDNSVRWILAVGFPILGPDGEIRRRAGFGVDITDQKTAGDTTCRGSER